MSTSLYELAVLILGDLPPQFQFAYIIFTLCLAIITLVCIFFPFIFVYKWFSK